MSENGFKRGDDSSLMDRERRRQRGLPQYDHTKEKKESDCPHHTVDEKGAGICGPSSEVPFGSKRILIPRPCNGKRPEGCDVYLKLKKGKKI